MSQTEKQYSLNETTINQVLAYLGTKPYTEVRTLVEAVLKAQLVPQAEASETPELTSVAN